MPFRNNIIFILAAFLMVSCAELKFVPEDRCLLNKVDVQSYEQTDHVNTGLLKSYVRQNANSRWFSAFKVPLGLYSLAGRDSSRWVNRILKSMGEAPVVFDSVFTAQTCDNLCKELQNEGFLRSKVKAHVVRKKRKVNVCYQLYPGAAYRIRGIDYEIQDSAIAQLLCLDDTENRGSRAVSSSRLPRLTMSASVSRTCWLTMAITSFTRTTSHTGRIQCPVLQM